MGKIENTWLETWKTKVSVSDKIKKIWKRFWDVLYNIFLTNDFWYGYTYRKNWKHWISWLTPARYDEFMLCGDNHIRAQTWNKWKLLDENWHEIENFEADDVVERCLDLTSWYWIYEWRVFCKNQKWWMVANDWTIVPAKYEDVSIYEFDSNGVFRTYAVWKEVLENCEEKLWEISIEDWSIKEYVEPYGDWVDLIDSIGSRSFKHEYRDALYNNVLRENVVTYEWWKKTRFHTYMEDGKIWIKWVLEPKYEALYLPFRRYSVAIVRLWDKFWLISARDGSIIREVEYDNIIENEKEKSLILIKWDDIERIYCDNFKESKQKNKAD